MTVALVLIGIVTAKPYTILNDKVVVNPIYKSEQTNNTIIIKSL